MGDLLALVQKCKEESEAEKSILQLRLERNELENKIVQNRIFDAENRASKALEAEGRLYHTMHELGMVVDSTPLTRSRGVILRYRVDKFEED